MELQLRQHTVWLGILGLSVGFFQEKLPFIFYICRIQKAHIPEHILDPFHTGFVRQGK